MSKVRVAMIGAGWRAQDVIYPAFSRNENVELVGICDIDPDRLKKVGDKYGIEKRYGSNIFEYQKMAQELKPDALVIIGNPHEMYNLWEWALKNGFNLYIEKPMGLTIHQARSLTYMAEQKNLITAVSFQRRYTPMVVKLREECLKRGPIVHAVCRFYKYMIQAQLNARDHMMDDCVHSIDTLRWICGGDVVSIDSHVKRVQTPDINFISATLQFDNGSTGYLINSWSSGKRVFEVEMHSPGIYVTAEHEIKGTVFAEGDLKGVDYDSKEVAGSDKLEDYTGVSAAVADFVSGIKTGKLPQTSFQSSVKTMEVAETILAQSLLKKL
jgi:virulence factor